MRKNILILTMLAVFLTLSACSKEKHIEKTYTVGIIQFTDTNNETRRGFLAGLKNYGYIEGENLRVIFDGPANTFKEINEKLEKIIEQKPDLIYAAPTPAAIAAYKMTKGTDIQVVFGPVNNPVTAGIVKNLKSPGENITGVGLAASDQKRLEWIKLISPETKNVLLPYNPADKSSQKTLKDVKDIATKLGMEVHEYKVTAPEEVLELTKNIPENTQAIFLSRDGMVMSKIEEFASIGIDKKIIVSTPRYEQVQQGAVTGYGFIGYELGKQAARLASAILKGAKAGDLPVETALDYLFINQTTAKAMGLHISDSILRQAYNPNK